MARLTINRLAVACLAEVRGRTKRMLDQKETERERERRERREKREKRAERERRAEG